MYRRKGERHSTFRKNGEDIEFEDADFHALAYHIASGPHEYSYTIYQLGLEQTFKTKEYILEVLHYQEFDWQQGRATLNPR